jgi:hypothetical protein
MIPERELRFGGQVAQLAGMRRLSALMTHAACSGVLGLSRECTKDTFANQPFSLEDRFV